MNTAITNEILQRLGWVLTHTLWEFALIALVVAFARGWLRSAASRYIVTSVGGAIFLFASAITLVLVMRHPLPVSPLDAPSRPLPAIQDSTGVTYMGPLAPDSTMIAAATPVPFATRARAAFESILPILPALYLAGLAAFSARLLVSYRHTRRLIATAHPASPNLHARVTDLARRVGVHRALRLLETAAVEVPCIVGGFRPVILVPAFALAKLAAAQFDALLAHELAHLRRWDDLANFMQCALETLFFYHPATWWLSAQVRQDREHCCDDIAAAICGDRVLYVSALTTLEELRTMTRLMPAARGGQLLKRIRRLLDIQDTLSRRLPVSVGIVLAIAIVATTILSIHAVQAQSKNLAPQPAASSEAPVDPTSAKFTLTAVTSYSSATEPDATTPATRPGEEAVVYIMGPVLHPGAYSLNAAKDLTVKKLIAIAGMDLPDVAGIGIVLTRRGENDKQEITTYSLAAIFSGETPDPRLKPGDVLWLHKSADVSKLEAQRAGLLQELNVTVSLYGVNAAKVKDLKARIAAIDNQIETGGIQAIPQDPAALDQTMKAGLEFQVESARKRFGENDPRLQSAKLRLDSLNKEIAAREKTDSVATHLSRLSDLRQALTGELDDARKTYGESNPLMIGSLQSRIDEVDKEIASLSQKKDPAAKP